MVDAEGLRTRALVARESVSTQQVLGQGLSLTGYMFYTTGPLARARIARETWSNPWDIGSELESPGSVGQHHWPSATGPSYPKQLVDHGRRVDAAGPRTQARVACIVGLSRGSSDTGPSWMG